LSSSGSISSVTPISASWLCSTCASETATGGSPVAAITLAVKPLGDDDSAISCFALSRSCV
jgi:hypothetical protein